MEKYVTNIKDLVIQALTNGSEIKTNAETGEAFFCLQMGMIHLLGINTAVDFKKAAKYLGDQSLENNQDAKCLLGFIAELEGNFSLAFYHYSNRESSEKDSYLDKVIKGRNHLQDYLKKLDLPITINKEISAVLGDYSKGKASKVGACIKIAAVCNDVISCLQAAKTLYDSKDYISAIQWLKKGNIEPDNSLYKEINAKYRKATENLLNSKEIQIIDLDDYSLLSTEDPTPFLNKVKKTCEETSKKNVLEWKDKNKKYIGKIIRIQKEKEKEERLAAEAEEEAERQKKKKIRKYVIIPLALFIVFFLIYLTYMTARDAFANAITIVASLYFWYFVIRWIVRKLKN